MACSEEKKEHALVGDWTLVQSGKDFLPLNGDEDLILNFNTEGVFISTVNGEEMLKTKYTTGVYNDKMFFTIANPENEEEVDTVYYKISNDTLYTTR